MADRFTEVTRTGYGKRVGRSLSGVIIGLILFVASFVVLFWNEGRQDMSLVATQATEIEANQVDSSADGNLVSTSGVLTSEETLGDDYLMIGDYIALKRTVEMYAWEETTEEETETSTGGSETTTTTYEYDTDWVESVPDSSDFKYPEEHDNPTKEIDSATKTVAEAKVGVYNINTETVTLPNYSSITLNEENIILPTTTDIYEETELKSNYIFIGEGSFTVPEVGDLRISYSAVKTNLDVTIFGQLDENKIVNYVDEDDNKLYRIFTGTREEAISTLHTEHVASTWIFRAVGFLMMWIGLGALLGPISTVLDFLPFLGKASRSIIGVITFIIALGLSALTIIISMIVHSLVAMIIIAIAVIIIIVVLIILMKKAKPSKEKQPSPEKSA